MYFNNGISLKNTTNDDSFIAKYNCDGICQWATSITGSGWKRIQGMEVDHNGNIIVAGYMHQTRGLIYFNNNITLTNLGYTNIFIAKYNNEGMCQWAQRLGGTGDDRLIGMSIDLYDDIYIIGSFTSSTFILNNGISITNGSGVETCYLSHFSSDGLCQWVEALPQDPDTYPGVGMMDMAVDNNGNIFIVGRYNISNLVFNNGQSIVNYGGFDGYLVKFDNTGICQWCKGIGGSAFDDVTSVNIDHFNNVYITGRYDTPILYFNNSISLNNLGGNTDVFFSKFDNDGNCQWAESIFGSKSESSLCISVDNINNIFIGGAYYSNLLTFNNQKFLTSQNTNSAFLAKYTQSIPPTLTTTTTSSITTSSASSGGNITSDGGASVSARGVVWSTSSNPTTTSNLGMTSDGTGTGTFTSSITGLTPNTLYHVRAYATNSAGTSYGDDLTLTTEEEYLGPSQQAASLVFSNVRKTSIDVRWTRGNGDGSFLVIKRASALLSSDLPVDNTVYRSQNRNYLMAPTLGTAKIAYYGTGNICYITGLSGSTTYYFMVCAYNGSPSLGTATYNRSTSTNNPRSVRTSSAKDGEAELISSDGTFSLGTIYPNPAKDNIEFVLDVPSSDAYTIEIYNEAGEMFPTGLNNIRYPEGLNNIKIGTLNLASGTYTLMVKSGNSFALQKFIISR